MRIMEEQEIQAKEHGPNEEKVLFCVSGHW